MIDKNHSDYEKYKSEFLELVEQEEKEMEKLEKLSIRGNDSQRDVIHKKYTVKIMELQKKYTHLFV